MNPKQKYKLDIPEKILRWIHPELRARQGETSDIWDEALFRLGWLKKCLTEKPKKTYPLGFDPEGEWLAEMSGDTGKYRPVKRTNQIKWLYARMGNVFHTEEEAARRSGGLNAHMDLVIAIHDGNHLYPDNGVFVTFLIRIELGICYKSNQQCVPLSLRMAGEKSFHYVIEKLGEKQIKRALEWGM